MEVPTTRKTNRAPCQDTLCAERDANSAEKGKHANHAKMYMINLHA